MNEVFHFRAWECAYALQQDYADRLTSQQRIAVELALMQGPERADLTCIALAAQVIGVRT